MRPEVGRVAFETIGRGRGVGLPSVHARFQVFMAGEADIGTRGEEKLRQFRLVGTMALGAIACGYWSMDGLGPAHPFPEIRVAAKANADLFPCKDACHGAPVGVVAG